VETIRDFGISNYIVQHRNLTRPVARTGFSVIAALSCALAVFLYALSSPVATFYGDLRLEPYVQILAFTALAGMIVSPLKALLLRDMQFRELALINFGATIVFTAVVIVLALSGYSYMSYAWGGLAMTLAMAALAIYYRPDFWIFRPGVHDITRALAFGGYSSLSDTLSRLNEALPFLILGRLMPLSLLGIFNRAHFISTVPPKLLMVGIMPVALPGFAAEARSGRDLKAPLLDALSYLAVVLWPALILLALLAYPAVMILLGEGWIEAVPIVQILSIAALASLPLPLAFPVLSAVGQVKKSAKLGLLLVPINAVVLAAAAPYGIHAVASTYCLLMPFQAYMILRMMKQHIVFGWRELFAALSRSAAIAVISTAPAAAIVAANGFSFAMPVPAAIAIGLMTIPSWLAAAWVVGHPVWHEIRSITASLIARDARSHVLTRRERRQIAEPHLPHS
jgi:O-antigen/teichoic acid export membrane protein